MKRYIKSSIGKIKCIAVEICVETIVNNVAACNSSYVKDLPGISKRIEQSKIDILNDIAESAMNSVTRFGFNVISHGQASNSYSYYIRFKVPQSEEFSDVLMVFRISDHTPNTGALNSKNSAVVIRSFNINNIGFRNSVQVIKAIDHMCEEMSKGNFDVLDEYAIDIDSVDDVM